MKPIDLIRMVLLAQFLAPAAFGTDNSAITPLSPAEAKEKRDWELVHGSFEMPKGLGLGQSQRFAHGVVESVDFSTFVTAYQRNKAVQEIPCIIVRLKEEPRTEKSPRVHVPTMWDWDYSKVHFLGQGTVQDIWEQKSNIISVAILEDTSVQKIEEARCINASAFELCPGAEIELHLSNSTGHRKQYTADAALLIKVGNSSNKRIMIDGTCEQQRQTQSREERDLR